MKLKWLTSLLILNTGIVFAEHQMELATPFSDKVFYVKNIVEFSQDIKKKTNNKVSITVHTGGKKLARKDILPALKSGKLGMGALLVSELVPNDALFKVNSIPFLATDYKSTKKLWEKSHKTLEAELHKKGMELLYTVPLAGQNLYSKAPVTDATFFKGKTMRVYNDITTEFAKHLGAKPKKVPIAKIAKAFASGEIDAMITSSETGVSSEIWLHAKNYTRINAWHPKLAVVINRNEWKKLGKKTQTQIKAVALAAEKKGWEISEQSDKANERLLTEKGMTIKDANPKLSKDLYRFGKRQLAKWLKASGKKGNAIIKAYRKR